jgi:hypothetical protein
VALVRTDVSEEGSASFIRVTRIGELGTTLAVTSIPEDAIFHEYFSFTQQAIFPLSSLSPSNPTVTGRFFPGVNLLGQEADHSAASSAEVMTTWIYTPIPPYAFTV